MTKKFKSYFVYKTELQLLSVHKTVKNHLKKL